VFCSFRAFEVLLLFIDCNVVLLTQFVDSAYDLICRCYSNKSKVFCSTSDSNVQ